MDELNLEGLDMNDPSSYDQVDIDNLLTGDGGSLEFNVADRELLNLMARDQQNIMATLPETDFGGVHDDGSGGYGQLNLGSSTSIDRLVAMPLGELGPSMGSVNADFHDFQSHQQQSPGSFEPDPLMNNPGNMNTMNNMMQQMNMQQQQQMMNQGMNQGMNQMMNQNNFQQQQNDNHIQRLEEEKRKLLAKLNAINQQQDQLNMSDNGSMMGMQQQPQQQQQQQQQQQDQMSQQQMLMMMQQQLSNLQQQQRQPQMNMQSNQMASLLQQQGGMSASLQRKPSLNTAVAGLTVKEPGESPLTSFLRAKGGGAGPSSAGVSGISALKTAGIQGASASVFSSTGTAVDPFNRNKLSGAMNASIQTQSMIKQLAMSNNNNNAKSAGGRGGNAQWGGVADSNKSQAYKYSGILPKHSGILPKHASDGHLLRGPNNGRPGYHRQGSKGKGDLTYGLGRSKGRMASQSKESLNKLTRKTSSSKLSNSALNRLDRKDSSGALPVRANRSAGGSKYKFGVSGSMGNLGSFRDLGSLGNLDSFANLGNPNQGGGGGGGQYQNQGNAQW